jgi:hypothetical protein
MAKLNGIFTNAARLTSARATKIDNIGATGDTGGSATAGTVMGKLNKAITDITTIDGIIDTINTNTAGNNTHGTQTYSTAGTYTWTCPSNVKQVVVTVVGGGGGGGGGSKGDEDAYSTSGKCASGASGGSGGSGCCITALHPVTPGTGYTVVVGAGGAGGAISGLSSTTDYVYAGNGANGGYSRFGDVRAAGGLGGKGAACGIVYGNTSFTIYSSKGGTKGGAAGRNVYTGVTLFYGGGAAGTDGVAGPSGTSSYAYENYDVKYPPGTSRSGAGGYHNAGSGGASGNGGGPGTGTWFDETKQAENDAKAKNASAGSAGKAGVV